MVLGTLLWSAVSPAPPCRRERIRHSRFSVSSFHNLGAGRTHLGPLGRSSTAVASDCSPVLLFLGGPCRSVLASDRNKMKRTNWARVLPRASVESAEYTVEPATSIKFQKDVQVPGCSAPLSLLGTGYREKVFAIIGVKVYAAGFYVDSSIAKALVEWKGRSATEILDNSTLFNSVFQDSKLKSLQIVLVRDVDGETFWNALSDVISPRIKKPTPSDEMALSTFRKTFEGRPLKKGTVIFLTWVEPSKMLVSISSYGIPSTIDAEIQSMSVTFALFDAYFGPSPVSPALKASVADGLMLLLDL